MNPDKIQHVIWDWNGTLLDDVAASIATINTMLDRRGLERLSPARYRQIFGFPVRDCYELMGFEVCDCSWDAIAKEFHEIYARESLAAPLRHDAVPTMTALAEQGITMSVLSASEQSILDRMVRDMEIYDLFTDVRGISNIYAGSKSDAARALVNSIMAEPETILLVGDTTHDFEVAEEAGVKCVLVQDGHQSLERISSCGCRVISCLNDIQGMI